MWRLALTADASVAEAYAQAFIDWYVTRVGGLTQREASSEQPVRDFRGNVVAAE